MKWVEDFRKIKYPAIIARDLIRGLVERINEKTLKKIGDIERVYAIGKGVTLITSDKTIKGKRVHTEYTTNLQSPKDINTIARQVKANFIIIRKSSNRRFATAKVIFVRL